jgi:co-chaperonin GroES (HSP10)
MKYIPVRNNILVKLKARVEEVNGILIPGQDNEQIKAEVISVGPGTPDCPMNVQPGDTVLITKNLGISVNELGEDYRVFELKYVTLIIRNDE